jgi:hypothetical protein
MKFEGIGTVQIPIQGLDERTQAYNEPGLHLMGSN